MTKPGYIEITDKVRFVYHELPKPLRRNYPWDGFHKEHFDKALKAYTASKRTVEVSNYYDLHEKAIRIVDARCQLENNQPCKAEINSKTAKIIELL